MRQTYDNYSQSNLIHVLTVYRSNTVLHHSSQEVIRIGHISFIFHTSIRLGKSMAKLFPIEIEFLYRMNISVIKEHFERARLLSR